MRMKVVRRICAVIYVSSLAPALAAPLIPATPGMAWRYNMTEEVGQGFKISNATPDADGKIRSSVLYRIAGTEKVDGKDVLKFEMHRNGVITNTDLLTVTERSIVCRARINVDGELVRLKPPQVMIAAPLKAGMGWNFNGEVGDLKMRQQFRVIGNEDVSVPAGKFRAFHIHGEQSAPSRTTTDRWFAPGVGIVKDITTMCAANGDLLQRIWLELAEHPRIMERPEVRPDAAAKQIVVSLAKDRFGKPATVFSPDTPQIYARWQGERLRKGARVKAVWIAENIGEDFPSDYKVDEALAVAQSPTAHGAFTVTRPEGGWAPGDYRMEFYLDDVLVESVKVKIVQ